jgi:putative transposase
VRFAFIQKHREQDKEYPVQLMCDILEVSRSGYYDWKDRAPSQRSKRRQELSQAIGQVHQESDRNYGSPKICEELNARGISVSENTVAKLMKTAGIRSKVQRRFVVQTTDSNHSHPVADNLLNRRFDWEKPDQAWCTDITCIHTDEGWLYLAAVMDLCSRKIVGWAMADHMRAELCVDALQMALEQRRPKKGLLHHSDRGVQYACGEYQELLECQGLVCSMSRTGNCYDNAAMESFFGILKRELVYHEHYLTREHARRSIFEYIEVFYNRKRRHSALDYKSPLAFEQSLN